MNSNWQSGNFYGQWNNPYCPKRPKIEEPNDIPQWTERTKYKVKEASKVVPVQQKRDQMLQTDEDELLKELRKDKQRLEGQIEEMKRKDANLSEQATQTETELGDLEAKSRLLEQKLQEARKQESKMQQRLQQLGTKHNQYLISAQMREAEFKEQIKKAEALNAALKEENDALKTEAEGDRMFLEVQKLEHSHFVREKKLKEEMETEKNKREEFKTEIETRIRSLKDEHDAMRAAHKVIHEKREKKLKDEITEAEKTIKGLNKDKKRLRRTKTNSELLVDKLRLEIRGLKTQAENEKRAAKEKLGRQTKRKKVLKHKLTLLKQKHDPKAKPSLEESSQTDPSVQRNQMEVEFLNLLNAKDQQIASVNDKLAKVQQELEELRGSK